MDFTIRLRAEGTAETRAQADAVKAVRTELEKTKPLSTTKISLGAPTIEATEATAKVKREVLGAVLEAQENSKIKPEIIEPKKPPRVLNELAKDAEDASKWLARLQSEQKKLVSLGVDPESTIGKDLASRIQIARDDAVNAQSRLIEAGGAGFDSKAYEKAEKEKKDKAKGSLSSAIALKTVLAQQGVEALKFAAGMAKANFQLALGPMGMARLSMISQQASFNMRRLFTGTNPRPLLDALQRTSQLIDPRTFTGKTIGDFLVRSSNSFFNMLAKAEPYARLFFKGMLYGALQVENTWLKLRIAIQPVLNLFPDGTGLMESFESGALAVKGAVGLMGVGLVIGLGKAAGALLSFGVSAFSALAPLLPFAAAVGGIVLAIDQLKKLMDTWDENSFSQITTKLKSDLGFASKEETEAAMSKRQGITTGDDYDRKYKLGKYAEKPPATATPMPKGAEKQAATAGPPIGKNLGLGMLAGMKDVQGKVEAGGRDLVLAAEGGAKKEAEIQSPARKWRREIGRQLGAGAALGLEDSAGDIEEAGRAAMPATPAVGGSGGRRGASVIVQQIGPFFGVGADIEATIRRVVPDVLDDMAERIGARV
jgi:hypothetical protein